MTTHPSTTTASGALIIASEPSRDGFLFADLDGGATARLLYQRCAEARAQGSPGQDFALLRLEPTGRAMSFGVADGVGSSYRGDFAASFLSHRLVDWLDRLRSPLPSEEPARTILSTELAAWTDAAGEELAAIPVDPEAPALVREVLEELRRDYGSETVFLAGRLILPDTTGSVEALFCWMGNVTMRLQCDGEEMRSLCADDDSARWSTLRGPRGELSARRMSLPGLRRLIVHTDGAAAIGPEIALLGDGDLQRRAAALLETATSDDVTALDLAWPASPEADQKRAEP